MTNPVPPSLDRFGKELDRAAHRELSATSASLRTRFARPRFLAGGSLGIAGIAAAATLALSGAASAPALAVTRDADGSVLVTVSPQTNQPWAEAADQRLASLGITEAIDGIHTAPGPATSSAPVACTPGSGAAAVTPSGALVPAPAVPTGPPIKVAFGKDGTEVIPSGTTGAGTAHLVSCIYYSTTETVGSGNTGG
jgi:hypothetical protein